MAEIVTIPCLRDNYAFLLHDPANGATAVIDVPEAAPIQAALDARGWSLSQIWLTHHHPDHIDGVPALQAATGARVVGAAADAHRLPPLDQALAEDAPHLWLPAPIFDDLIKNGKTFNALNEAS